jgi:glutaminase
VVALWLAEPSAAQAQEAGTKTGKSVASTKGAATTYQRAVDKALSSYKNLEEGKNASYIPALDHVDPHLYGIALVTVDGRVYEAGDARVEFAIESAAKPFVLARTMADVGPEAVQKRIGVNQTGQPFNSVIAMEMLEDAKQPPSGNPFVNAGAIATVDMLPAASPNEKWTSISETLSGFAGRNLTVNQTIYQSEAATNTHNRGIANLLKDYKVIQGDPMQALDLYTKQSSVNVTARDMATMGATLANAGRNPLTGKQVVPPEVAKRVLAVMATNGLYETTGAWLYEVGVPAKSGVGGGIVAVAPGRFAIGTFSPPLDHAGNSVRGQRAIASIVQALDASMFGARAQAQTHTTPHAALNPPLGAATATTAPGAAKPPAP